MTHLSPGGGAMPGTVSRPPSVQRHPFSRAALTRQSALRRARLADYEAAMIAACEATRSGTSAGIDRAHWNRAAWRRYLAVAMRMEATYDPRMRRLRLEIGQLERLMTLPIAA